MMSVVEVFRTNVTLREDAEALARLLLLQYPGGRITFDLDDRDRVLRAEHVLLCAKTVVETVQAHGYECQLLEY